MEWIPEKVLQKYVRDNPQKFSYLFDGKTPHIQFNDIMDRYPDLTFVIDNKTRIPVEVEWKTSNFLAHKHSPEVLSEGKGYDRPGFLLVAKIEPQISVGNIEQFELDLEDFEKWFERKSGELVSETTEELHKISDERKLPKLWFTYLSLKGDGVTHFETALKYQVWGVQKNYRPTTRTQISGIKKGDLVAFIGPGKNFPGRVPISEWIKKSFKGYFEKIRVYRITSDYSDKDSSVIWKTKGKWKDEVFPHRFNFDRVPLFILKNCKINKMSLTTKKELHSMVYSNIRMCNPSSLVDILHNAEKLNLEESKAELDYISKIIS